MVTTTYPRLARSCAGVVSRVLGSARSGENITTGNGLSWRATGAPMRPPVRMAAQFTVFGGTPRSCCACPPRDPKLAAAPGSIYGASGYPAVFWAGYQMLIISSRYGGEAANGFRREWSTRGNETVPTW